MTTPSTSILLPQSVDIRAALRRNERRIVIPGLKGSAAACIIAEILRSETVKLLVMTSDQDADGGPASA